MHGHETHLTDPTSHSTKGGAVSVLVSGVWNILFPQRGRIRQISWRYVTLLLVLPVLAGVVCVLAALFFGIRLQEPGVIAGSFGVLGGLLFAHAIFVFQLRVTYDASGVEPAPDAAQEDLRVRPLIDEMFVGVLYASLVALVLTFGTAFLAATREAHTEIPLWAATGVAVVATHLGGCVLHVISATTTAYGTLKRQPRGDHRKGNM